MCELGYLGQKTGKGYYNYKDGSRIGTPDVEIEKLIENLSTEMGIKRREIKDEEIVERLIYPIINEAAYIVEEEIVAKSSDIDVVWCHGYGWPIWRSGPAYYADYIGLAYIVKRLEYYAHELDDESLKPAPLLQRLVKSHGKFQS